MKEENDLEGLRALLELLGREGVTTRVVVEHHYLGCRVSVSHDYAEVSTAVADTFGEAAKSAVALFPAGKKKQGLDRAKNCVRKIRDLRDSMADYEAELVELGFTEEDVKKTEDAERRALLTKRVSNRDDQGES